MTDFAWSALRFRYPFRKYQRMILTEVEDVLDTPRDDRRYHIVAPPGSGKTIVGLELIRRFARPALVLTPTVTIQLQWREKWELFLPEGNATSIDDWVSTDPDRSAPIRIFTYQRLAVQDAKYSFTETASRTAWAEELVAKGIVANAEAGQQYLNDLAAHNPQAYRKEIRRRYPRLKRDLLRQDPAQVAHFLHPNALALIDRLVAEDIGTIVLDECHHLLDYWAVVLRYLISRLDAPRVVGLTATLPSPEDDFAYENYTTLLGEVDFEVPTPAVVKEGNLAPYRDLVYFTTPTPEEEAFLEHLDEHFWASLGGLLTSDHLLTWLNETLGKNWQQVADEDPSFALAGLRWLRQQGLLAPDFPLPPEAKEDANLEDWIVLIEQFALRVLVTSHDQEDHERFQELSRRLKPFGFTLTPRGLYQRRTPGDLVLSFSDSKIHATQEILRREKDVLGERLRAIVVTDFEQSTSGLRRLDRQHPTIEADLGSARRVFRYLVQDSTLSDLHPVLITGRSLWIDADFRPAFENFWKTFHQETNGHIELAFHRRDGYYEVRGKGGWGPRVYVPLLTEAMERGLTRLLVGTRGLFGEGWDALSLNVLIDLTSTTTSTSVQQLRGRSLRKDPQWPHKVAHNWDVICVAPQFSQGNLDLKRLIRRHKRFWGVIIAAPTTSYIQHVPFNYHKWNFLIQKLSGRISKGIIHIDPYLAIELTFSKWKEFPFKGFTRLMLSAIAQREETYRAWGIGDPYDNYEYRLRQIRPRDWRIRTVYTLTTTVENTMRVLKKLVRNAFLIGIFFVSKLSSRVLSYIPPHLRLPTIFLTFALGIVATYLDNKQVIHSAFQTLLIKQPPETILLDIGRALLQALREAGLISRKLNADYVRVAHNFDDTYTVQLDYASPEDAGLFIQAFGEILAPIRNQRYLILHTHERLPKSLDTFIWRTARKLIPPKYLRPTYYPVPEVLSTHRKYADALARAWERYIGGGQLVYTRSPEGRQILYQARLQEHPPVEDTAFTFWH